MKKKELAELEILIRLCDATNCAKPNKDGRRIAITDDGYCIDVDKIVKRTKELLSKFLKPYKIKK